MFNMPVYERTLVLKYHLQSLDSFYFEAQSYNVHAHTRVTGCVYACLCVPIGVCRIRVRPRVCVCARACERERLHTYMHAREPFTNLTCKYGSLLPVEINIYLYILIYPELSRFDNSQDGL